MLVLMVVLFLLVLVVLMPLTAWKFLMGVVFRRKAG